MFYELNHPATADHFAVEQGINFSFPAHMHPCFEFILSTSGSMEVLIDGVTYRIREGEAVLVFPDQIHSLVASENQHVLLIFTPFLVQYYYNRIKTRAPKSNFFKPSEEILHQLRHIEGKGMLARKGFLYLLCDAFDSGAEYVEKKDKKDADLLGKTFLYIEEHFKEDCSLQRLSQRLRYNSSYLSRAFAKAVGIQFHEYVNIYRLNHACHLLQETDLSILNCAFDSGFKTLSSFNRNFKKTFDLSPSEYRARASQKK
ncbi:MAG: helix-turn-helix transcriptional regulator [Clostridia bacterium]|nr:helix-turn-helix transcriptional regulator [Clostridia bacterium]